MPHCEDTNVHLYTSGTSNIGILNMDSNEVNLLSLCKALYDKSIQLCVPTTKFAFIQTGSLIKGCAEFSIKFVQYIPSTNKIDLKGNCGNAIVASYMYIREKYGVEKTKIYTINTGKTSDLSYIGRDENGNEQIATEFLSPAGSITKSILPLGAATNRFSIPEIGIVEVSVVDAGNPYVWMRSETVSKEDSALWGNKEFNRMMIVREYVQRILQIEQKSVFPKVAVVAPRNAPNHDIQAKMITVPTWHPTFALTGLVCMCAALSIEGSIVNDMAPHMTYGRSNSVNVLTPGGIMYVEFSLSNHGILYSVAIVQKVKKIGGVTVDYSELELV